MKKSVVLWVKNYIWVPLVMKYAALTMIYLEKIYENCNYFAINFFRGFAIVWSEKCTSSSWIQQRKGKKKDHANLRSKVFKFKVSVWKFYFSLFFDVQPGSDSEVIMWSQRRHTLITVRITDATRAAWPTRNGSSSRDCYRRPHRWDPEAWPISTQRIQYYPLSVVLWLG